MSHFYGKVRGAKGEATRCGTKNSGMETYCAAWGGAVRCYAYVNSKGIDCVLVEKTAWEGRGENKLLYDGPIGEIQTGLVESFGSRIVEKLGWEARL